MAQPADCRRFPILFPAALYLFFIQSLAAQPEKPSLVVHVYNNANVSSSVLAEAGVYVKETLARIQVEAIWVDETSRLHGADTPTVPNSWSDRSTAHVSLAIVPNAEGVAPHLKNDEAVMGWTPAGQSERAYVFYNRVEEFVSKNGFRVYGLRLSRIVAYAVEHELGHLLIPPLANAHSETGIMKTQLGPGDLAPTFFDTIGFSAKEGEWMRTEIQRRASKSAH